MFCFTYKPLFHEIQNFEWDVFFNSERTVFLWSVDFLLLFLANYFKRKYRGFHLSSLLIRLICLFWFGVQCDCQWQLFKFSGKKINLLDYVESSEGWMQHIKYFCVFCLFQRGKEGDWYFKHLYSCNAFFTRR